ASATGVKTRPPRPRVCASRPRSRLGHRGEVAPTEVEGRPHVRQRAGTAPRSFATPDLTPTCRVHHRDRVFLTAGGTSQGAPSAAGPFCMGTSGTAEHRTRAHLHFRLQG